MKNAKQLTTKVVAMLVAIIMVASMLPVVAFANEGADTEEYVYISVSYDEKYKNDKNGKPIVDENGNGIKNARVKIKQTSHEFKYGANIFMLDELETEEKNEKYKKYFSEVFNQFLLFYPFFFISLIYFFSFTASGPNMILS